MPWRQTAMETSSSPARQRMAFRLPPTRFPLAATIPVALFRWKRRYRRLPTLPAFPPTVSETSSTATTMTSMKSPSAATPQVATWRSTPATNFCQVPFLATDGSNNVYVMDYLGVVYELDLNDPPTVTFPTTAQGNVSPQQTVTIRNGGNQPFSFSPPATYGPNPVISQYFTLDTTSAGTCGELIGSTPTPVLQPGDTCTLPINFAPVSPALDATNGTLTLADDNLNINNATQVISLTGDAALLGQTSAALSSSLNASSLGQSITFTASIASFSGTSTGSVTFTDGWRPSRRLRSTAPVRPPRPTPLSPSARTRSRRPMFPPAPSSPAMQRSHSR